MRVKFKFFNETEFDKLIFVADDYQIMTAENTECIFADKNQKQIKNYGYLNIIGTIFLSVNITSLNIDKLKKNQAYYFSLYFNEFKLYSIYFNSVQKVNLKKDKNLLVFENQIINSDDIVTMHILWLWSLEENLLSWRMFLNKQVLTAWQTACLCWSDYEKRNHIYKKRLSHHMQVEIHPDNFSSHQEFFCYIGEAFLGKRGYMGKSSNVFFELLDELFEKYEVKSISVKIYNNALLKDKLDGFENVGKDFYDYFFGILSNCHRCFIEYIDN